jgi:rod shape-determining protein MreC
VSHQPSDGPRRRSSRTVLILLVLASLTVITLDAKGGAGSPVEPLRTVVGSVVGPAETVTATVARPFARLGSAMESNRSLRKEVATLTARNSELRGRMATDPIDRARLAELDGLTRTAQRTGYDLVAARVVGMGAAQSFNRTVTLNVGTSSGVRADMTVVNADGLVGRVVRATRTTSTVLLVVDRTSAVGGRLGANLEVGYLKGRGGIGDKAALDLALVDNSITPSRGDAVVTWGSDNGVPYVAGIPIGEVGAVFSTPRESAVRAVIKPFVDFTSLDVVGVVVPKGTTGDRPVISGSTR